MVNTMSKNLYIETLGCQMNKSDSELIAGLLQDEGYQLTEEPKQADLLIINTCSIRAAAEDKAYSYLGVWGKMKRANPDIKICMCGCVAQQAKGDVFKRAPYVDLVFGTHNIHQLPELIKSLDNEDRLCAVTTTPVEPLSQDYTVKRQDGISAWLPIIEGCDYFCTYCIVPYTRGRQRSRKPEDILREAEDIAKHGFKEIILLGQTVDSYGNDCDDPGINLANLLKKIHKIDNILRIRFVTSYPTEITDELIETVRDLEKVCEYFHIPMQAGNNELLSRMKRRYTREEYIELVNKIRASMPNVSITSDFIAGFPGETEEQFEDTLSIINEIVFDHCNTAAYSPRKRTPAATWNEQIPQEVKKQRLNRLNDKVKENVVKSNQRFLNSTVEVLVENKKEEGNTVILSGRTRENKIVHFESEQDLIGCLVNINVKEASIWCLKGDLA